MELFIYSGLRSDLQNHLGSKSASDPILDRWEEGNGGGGGGAQRPVFRKLIQKTDARSARARGAAETYFSNYQKKNKYIQRSFICSFKRQ